MALIKQALAMTCTSSGGRNDALHAFMPYAVWEREGTTETLFLFKNGFWWKTALRAAASFPSCPSLSPVLPLRLYHPSACSHACYPLYLSPLRSQCRIVWAIVNKDTLGAASLWNIIFVWVVLIICCNLDVITVQVKNTHSVTGCVFLLSCGCCIHSFSSG